MICSSLNRLFFTYIKSPTMRCARWFIVLPTLAALTAWVHLAQFSSPLEWDSQIYLIIGRWLHEGVVPYGQVWVLKPPGIFAYIAGVFAILPTALWSVRFVDYGLFVGAACAFYALCRRSGVTWGIALCAAGLWAVFLHHPFYDVGGLYTEEYVAVFSVFALLAAVSDLPVLAGALVGTAALFKQPGALVILPLLLFCRSWRCVSRLTIGLVLPVAVTAVYFAGHGLLWRFVETNVTYAAHYSASRTITDRAGDVAAGMAVACDLRIVAAITIAAVLGSFIRRSRIFVAAWLWVLVVLVGIAGQGWAGVQRHYWIQFFGPLLFIAAVSIQALLPDWRVQTVAVAFLGWLFAAPISGFVHRRDGVVRKQWQVLLAGPSAWREDPGLPIDREIGEYLRDHTQPSDRVYVAVWNGHALSVYWYAQRLPASPWICLPEVKLFQLREKVKDALSREAVYVVTQRSDWSKWAGAQGLTLEREYPGPLVIWRRT
jgi:hypothetical protein